MSTTVPLGRSGIRVSRVAFGAVKIGRNRGLKYPAGFELPAPQAVETLLDGLVSAGVATLDTAPAYGLSEARIGDWLSRRPGLRERLTLCTKTGEEFDPATERSRFDFSAPGTYASVERSLEVLGVSTLDIVHVHSNGDDLEVQAAGCVEALRALKASGRVRAVGFSGKSVGGTRAALAWADSVMVTCHRNDPSHLAVMREAREQGVGVMVKKGLGSGGLPADEALAFLGQEADAWDSVVIGSLNLEHMRANAASLEAAVDRP